MKLHSERFRPLRLDSTFQQEPTRGAALPRMQQAFDVLVVAEKDAAEHPHIEVALDLLPWSRSPWIREMLVGLAETNFEDVPVDILAELEDWLEGHRTSVLAERSFNYLRDRCRHVKSGQMGGDEAFPHFGREFVVGRFRQVRPLHATTSRAICNRRSG